MNWDKKDFETFRSELNLGRMSHAQVVEYTEARKAIYLANGSCIRKESDHLLVYKRPEERYTCYLKEEDRGELLNSLYVDEGFFTDAYEMGQLVVSKLWHEYVDTHDLLAAICKLLDLSWQTENSFIGRGRQSRNEIEAMCKVLVEFMKQEEERFSKEEEVVEESL